MDGGNAKTPPGATLALQWRHRYEIPAVRRIGQARDDFFGGGG
jgi:hypothetical protein